MTYRNNSPTIHESAHYSLDIRLNNQHNYSPVHHSFQVLERNDVRGECHDEKVYSLTNIIYMRFGILTTRSEAYTIKLIVSGVKQGTLLVRYRRAKPGSRPR